MTSISTGLRNSITSEPWPRWARWSNCWAGWAIAARRLRMTWRVPSRDDRAVRYSDTSKKVNLLKHKVLSCKSLKTAFCRTNPFRSIVWQIFGHEAPSVSPRQNCPDRQHYRPRLSPYLGRCLRSFGWPGQSRPMPILPDHPHARRYRMHAIPPSR
jgi:hypothetical protein